jgi:hypothetical protein
MTILADFAESLSRLLDGEELIIIIAIVLGCTTGMVGIIAKAISGTAKTRSREAARREIAAYVAEGSIDPDKAVALLNAGPQQADVLVNVGKSS